MANTRGARAGLDQRVAEAAVPDGGGATLPALIERQAPEIHRALPVHLKDNAEGFVRAALTLVKQTPLLMQCDARTVLGGLMTASQLGLEFGPLGHAYLVPFKNNRTNRMEAQFILGYKGAVDLAWRSGQLASIIAREVYPEDEFEYEYGLADRLFHKPALNRAEDSKPYIWYGVAKFKDGGHAFVVLGKDDVDRHRRRSKASDKGPWVTDYSAMAKKSCILELKPWLPLTSNVLREMAKDGTVIRGSTVDDLETPEYIDVEGQFAADDVVAEGEVVGEGAPEEGLFANTQDFADGGHD